MRKISTILALAITLLAGVSPARGDEIDVYTCFTYGDEKTGAVVLKVLPESDLIQAQFLSINKDGKIILLLSKNINPIACSKIIDGFNDMAAKILESVMEHESQLLEGELAEPQTTREVMKHEKI